MVAVAITHERPRPLFWIASLAGAALVIAFALRQGGGALSTGDLLLFAAVAVSAIGYAFSGRLTAEKAPAGLFRALAELDGVELTVAAPESEYAALTARADLILAKIGQTNPLFITDVER